jgi:hypothetical protein
MFVIVIAVCRLCSPYPEGDWTPLSVTFETEAICLAWQAEWATDADTFIVAGCNED